MSAILKQHGHPMIVASRYRERPGRGLISPDLFPFYWFTVRAVFGLWVIVRVIIAVFQFEGTATAGAILLRLGRDILLAGFIITSGVTLLFAIWEYLEFRFRYSQRWKPESLPAVPPPVRQRPPRPVVQITGQVVWVIFWAMALFVPAMWWVWGGRGVFGASDAVYAVRLPIWLLALGGFAQSWLNYTRFATAEWRAWLRFAVYTAGIVLAVYVLRAGDLLTAGPNWDPTQAKPLATLNQLAGGVLVMACIFAGLLCVHELRPLHTKERTALGAQRSSDRAGEKHEAEIDQTGIAGPICLFRADAAATRQDGRHCSGNQVQSSIADRRSGHGRGSGTAP